MRSSQRDTLFGSLRHGAQQTAGRRGHHGNRFNKSERPLKRRLALSHMTQSQRGPFALTDRRSIIGNEQGYCFWKMFIICKRILPSFYRCFPQPVSWERQDDARSVQRTRSPARFCGPQSCEEKAGQSREAVQSPHNRASLGSVGPSQSRGHFQGSLGIWDCSRFETGELAWVARRPRNPPAGLCLWQGLLVDASARAPRFHQT